MSYDSVRLGNAVRDARNAKGWTQPELAEKAGIHASTIKQIEGGRPFTRWPSSMVAIEKALGRPEGWAHAIADGSVAPEAAAEFPAPQIAHDRDGMQIIALAVAGMAQLTPAQLRKVLADINAELAADPLDEPSDGT